MFELLSRASAERVRVHRLERLGHCPYQCRRQQNKFRALFGAIDWFACQQVASDQFNSQMCALRVVKDTIYLFKGQLRKITRTHKIAGQNSSRRTDPMATTVHAIIKTSTDRFKLDIGTVAQYSLFTPWSKRDE